MLASGLIGSPAGANTPARSWTPSTNPTSDPFIIPCTTGGRSGLCLYTSQDMPAAGDPSVTGNYYPMNQTHLSFLPDGKDPGRRSNWVDKGAVLSESQYPWVPNTSPGIPVPVPHQPPVGTDDAPRA